jgi:hypothetical protein
MGVVYKPRIHSYIASLRSNFYPMMSLRDTPSRLTVRILIPMLSAAVGTEVLTSNSLPLFVRVENASGCYICREGTHGEAQTSDE